MLLLSVLLTLSVSQKPAMRDFIGLNVHTVLFKPDLYRPVTSVVRDYHSIGWDLGDSPNNAATFPMTRDGVNWLDLYGTWKEKGYRIDVTVQFDGLAPETWTPTNEFAYGEAFARYFGPSGPLPMVDSVEIGNEPAEFNEIQYRSMFENMARGVRKADPKLKIVTCAAALGKQDKYSKDVACLSGLESLIDVVNVHTYPFVEGYPTWLRSYPEDPKINYLKQAEQMIQWRNAHVPGRPVWVTEFGYDSTTKPNKKTGDFVKWVGNSDEQQAQYIVRSYLVFSEMDIDKAYLYFFNDSDDPQLHGSSGLTRDYKPKPSFYAVAHLQKTLGDFRFDRALLRDQGAVYAFQFRSVKNTNRYIWVVWSPTGSNRTADVALPNPKGKVIQAERMPLSADDAEQVPFKVGSNGQINLTIGERPIYLTIQR